MDNVHLSRRVDKLKFDIESISDELIQEVEDKETEIDRLNNEIQDLNDRIVD